MLKVERSMSAVEERLKIGSTILLERDNEYSTDSLRVNSNLNSDFLDSK